MITERSDAAPARTATAGGLSILLAAVVQGWVLYGLHLAIRHETWPVTAPPWLFACYTLAVFLPLTVQLLREHVRRADAWAILGVLGAAFFYFGWHHGAMLVEAPVRGFAEVSSAAPTMFVLLVLWLMVLPFVQLRLASGKWSTRYEALFDVAWRNKLVLAEAALFTGLFWLLLSLWQGLFRMLGIDFFKALFRDPMFVYPVTSLVFGLAVHLIGSIEKFTRVVLEQLLNVLKWLALLAGLILALFTAALTLKLPGLVTTGQRAIEAYWLLWLVAVMVLLLNAAYRDGSVREPYPRWIGLALRLVVPLTVLVSATALYALYVRIDTYGFTVQRVWAAIVTVAAFIYSVGYAVAAWRSAAWMGGMSRVNVATALALIAVIALTQTPVLSPQRIAANSQFAMALRTDDARESPHPAQAVRAHGTPLHYLRFDAGRYGMARLEQLAALESHPRAEQIRQAARRMLEQRTRWERLPTGDMEDALANLEIFPSGRTLDPGLHALLATELRQPELARLMPAMGADGGLQSGKLAGVYVDLDADDEEEFVLIGGLRAFAYRRDGTTWSRIGAMSARFSPKSLQPRPHLERGEFAAEAPRWRDLTVGDLKYRFEN